MKRIALLIAITAASLRAAPADKTLNLSVYSTSSGKFLNQAFTVSGNNGKVLGITGGAWALVTPSGGSGTGDALTTDPLSQFAATTSAQLRGVISDESGTGALLFAGGNIGAATATSLNGLTISTTTGTLAISSGKTLTSSNTLTFSGTDGSTLNIGAGGTLGAAALLGTSAGGNGTADNGKAVIFGTGGILDATTELTVHNAANAAHAYLADDGTIGFHAVGATNPSELVFPDDIPENTGQMIATRDWVTANGSAFDATTLDAVTWSDGANASNVWTFNVSGTDPTFTAGNNNFIFGSGSIDLGSAGVRLSQDGDGALTFLGLGNGSDEDLTLNFDDTSNSIVASSSTGAGIDLSGLPIFAGALGDQNGVPLHTTVAAVGLGTAYTMTATYASVDMGTTDPSIPITAAGTYMVWANVQTSYSAATYAALNSMTFRLYEQTGASALTDGERGEMIPVMTTITNLGPSIMIGPVEHVTADTDDVIVLQGDLGALPDNAPTGKVTVTKATVYAVRVR